MKKWCSECGPPLKRAQRRIAKLNELNNDLQELNDDLVALLIKRDVDIRQLIAEAAETKIGLEIMGTMTPEQM